MKSSFFNKKLIIVLLFFSFLPIFQNGVHAKRNVKVATIGARPPQFDKSIGYEQMVKRMINFWQREISNVLPDKPDLIVLQEACDFPWGLNSNEKNEYVNVRKDKFQDFIASVAKENKCYILFGTKRVSNDGTSRNSGVLMDRNGKLAGIYDKNYPTIGEIESGIVPSNEVPILKTDFGRIAVALCFDLNYEEHMARYVELKPDIILFPSVYHGGFIQSVWAYTCRSYFVGAIRTSGRNSEIINPLGEIIASSTNYANYAVKEINLDYKLAHLDYNRQGLKKLKEKYGTEVDIHDPGGLGVVMVTSNHDTINANQMLKEFGIEVLDDYFSRSRKARAKAL